MKKLILLISILAIILSGCSMGCKYKLSSVSEDDNDGMINTFWIKDKGNSFFCESKHYIKYEKKEVEKMYQAIKIK